MKRKNDDGLRGDGLAEGSSKGLPEEQQKAWQHPDRLGAGLETAGMVWEDGLGFDRVR